MGEILGALGSRGGSRRGKSQSFAAWLLVSALVATLVVVVPEEARAAGPPSGFTVSTVFSGLVQPTAVEFAPDGRAFVAEKRGTVKVYDGLSDPTPTVTIDVQNDTHNFWDRGLLGMALDPDFATNPYVYLLYTLDPGNSWGDGCSSPPGATGDGCVVNGRLSRFRVSSTNSVIGSEQILLQGNWCQQYPSHSIGALVFGPNRDLMVSAGDGASFNNVDYGQFGGSSGSPTPKNPCGDPPGGVGGAMSPPTAEGGALRSQDLRTTADSVSYDGTILRVNPDTGAALSTNPLIGGSTQDDRIIAYGLRNPFRMTARPGSNEIWVGDVGWNSFEELNRIVSPTDSTVENFGWPCYEGNGRQSGYDSANLNLCESLYNGTAGVTVTAPYVAYAHGGPPDPNGCAGGGASSAGMAFYDQGPYPASYDGALFFGDYSYKCIWVMPLGANGQPNPAAASTFLSGIGLVGLTRGPAGDIFIVDYDQGRILRISYPTTNNPPVAVVSGSPLSGVAPLSVSFDGSGSSDPDGDVLTFAWDLDGDG
ncbi:MAG TPA: PQQ-dependent sugar dehydrogenase, partial [Acidimicrobiia bacterium]|nr:PQQ-dependent sugar dehydrogenase [Acidimicrobiia bacterium]